MAGAHEIAILKRGPWATIGTIDSVCPAWAFTAEGLLDDLGWEFDSVEMADGTHRVYRPVRGLWSVSLQGRIDSVRLPDGSAAAGTLAALRTNEQSLRSAVTAGRGSGDGRITIVVKEGIATLATLKATVLGFETSDRVAGPPASCAAVLQLQIAGAGT